MVQIVDERAKPCLIEEVPAGSFFMYGGWLYFAGDSEIWGFFEKTHVDESFFKEPVTLANTKIVLF